MSHQTGQHDLRAIASQFQVDGEFLEGSPFGNGHINDTYLASYRTPAGPLQYIHQRINHAVFKEPEKVMENIERVTKYGRERLLAAGSDPQRRVLSLVPARDGRSYYRDPGGNTWRTYHYIAGTCMFEDEPSMHVIYSAARAFGDFQMLLSGLPGARLHETIPDFHHTHKRFLTFQQALQADPLNRAAGVREEIEFILHREEDTVLVIDMLAQGRLPERVTHNDTKINNVLIDETSGEGLCVIDLDTVMPGSALYDFGDMVRAGAAAAAEDEPNPARAGINMDAFIQLARGYSDAVRDLLTTTEWELLAFSGKLITLEQAIRFLGDYLNGDTYYKIHRPNQNLDRARTQITMVAEIEQKMGLMEAIVARCRQGNQN